MSKHLDAKGRGELDYDYSEDTLFFKVKDRAYAKSIDLDDVVVDIDKEGFITGVQLFSASKLFRLDKEVLRNIKLMEFTAKAEHNIITIQLIFKAIRRNRQVVERGQNLVRVTDSPLKTADVLCTAA